MSNKMRTYEWKKDTNLQAHGSLFETNTWVVSGFIVDKIIPTISIHPYPLNELMLMVSAMLYYKPTLVFDWGTHLGKSARIFYETSQYFKIDTTVHTFDLQDPDSHNEHPHSELGHFIKGKTTVRQHLEDGVTGALKVFGQHKVTSALFFLDGDHSYESVKRELETIFTKAPGQPILIHDTFFQSEESSYNVGPSQAIREFMQVHSDTYSLIETAVGLPGMALLVPRT